MKIHIFGASGSGVTTLGKALAKKLNIPYFDSDHYFWIPTDPPFITKRNPKERNDLIKMALTESDHWVFGGSSVSWGDGVFPEFDLIVFLWLPPEVRLNRLKKREFERYGSVIYQDPERIKKYQDFIEWATNYDIDPIKSGFTGRSLKVHEDWIKDLNKEILEIRGDFTLEERIKKIIDYLETKKDTKWCL
ncbi:P-loop NTPase family protein [Pedobacter kyonggii]|uniref:Adenylate kinase n=1 Tax=Pedobacter kyonggii TaxID=1926871 RepID=A0A4Q9HFR0_9SPHI|nr:shikimate kinase [Pedobacter kyonggii]TBO43918.1 adenylate kinase [Pedobacter kyonggii]